VWVGWNNWSRQTQVDRCQSIRPWLGQAIKTVGLSVVRTSLQSVAQCPAGLTHAVSTGRVVGDGWWPRGRLSTPSLDRWPSSDSSVGDRQVDRGQTTGQRDRERSVEWLLQSATKWVNFTPFRRACVRRCPSLTGTSSVASLLDCLVRGHQQCTSLSLIEFSAARTSSSAVRYDLRLALLHE